MNVNIIETSGLGKRYGSTWALREDGKLVSQSAIRHILQGYHPATATRVGPNTSVTILNPAGYLAKHGYTHWLSYQPGSRFWPFQSIEGGWLLALSVLLIAATVWLVRRRAA
jgi:hypothetical protein